MYIKIGYLISLEKPLMFCLNSENSISNFLCTAFRLYKCLIDCQKQKKHQVTSPCLHTRLDNFDLFTHEIRLRDSYKVSTNMWHHVKDT